MMPQGPRTRLTLPAVAGRRFERGVRRRAVSGAKEELGLQVVPSELQVGNLSAQGNLAPAAGRS